MVTSRYGSDGPDHQAGASSRPWYSRLQNILEQIFPPPESDIPVRPVMAPPPSPPVFEVLNQRRDAKPFTVPAQGDAFDFQVHATFAWTAHRMTKPDFQQRVDARMSWATSIVIEEAARGAREFFPHQANGLERTLNNRFAGLTWPGENPLRFSARVRVQPDSRVRERLRPYWEERIKLECEHELNLLRAAHADELTRRWRAVFDGLEKELSTPHPAQLAGDRFAKVFGEYLEERRKIVPDLVTLLEQAIKGNELVMGPLEYTEAWDLALRTYRKQYGLADAN